MTAHPSRPITDVLAAAGLAGSEVAVWRQATPDRTTDFTSDRRTYFGFCHSSSRLMAQLAPRMHRNEAERVAARMIRDISRAARVRFMRTHADAVYDLLTQNRSRFERVQNLVLAAADAVPGLVPSAQQ